MDKKKQCKGRITVGDFGRDRPCRKTAVRDGFCLSCHPDEKEQRQENRIKKAKEKYDRGAEAFKRMQALETLAVGIPTDQLHKYVLKLKE